MPKRLLAFIAGALLPLAFAPLSWWPIAFLSPAALLMLLQSVANRRALTLSYYYGIGFFGVGVSWVYISIHVYGNTPTPLAALFTLIFILFLALFFVLQTYLWNLVKQPAMPILNALLFAACWLLSEFFRSHLLTGFPWLLLGYSQTSSPLRFLAPVIGVSGLSFLAAFIAASLVKPRIRSLLIIGCIAAGTYVAHITTWTQALPTHPTVSLIQGNIPQELKWSDGYVNTTVQHYDQLTNLHWKSNLIVWPEGALPVPYSFAESYLKTLDEDAKKAGSTVILGIPVEAKQKDHYYNAVVALGKNQGRYYKTHLVPFGEFLPLSHLLRGIINFFDIPMSDFVIGPRHQANLQGGNFIVAPFICYEIAYPDAIRDKLPEANILLTLTNDAWFGNSLAPWQHAEIAQMVALETGRTHMMTGNDGITVVYDAAGREVSKIPQFQTDVLTTSVELRQGTTPWVRYGNAPLYLLMSALLLLGLAFRQRQTRRDLSTLPSPLRPLAGESAEGG